MLKLITLNAIIEYIENNLESIQINTKQLVDYSGFSRRYIQLLFKKHIGISIGKYIQLRRASRAAVLLKLTNIPLADIASKLFYDSQQTFTREFKKNTGYTPLQYRNQNVWTFPNLIGSRYTKNTLPPPRYCYLNKTAIYGRIERYIEKIPHTGTYSKPRRMVIDHLISISKSPVYLSNKVIASKKVTDAVDIETVYWDKNKRDQQIATLPEGCYAYFIFNGGWSDYIEYINNIYMNTLAFYGLQKKGDYDIEVISQSDNGDYVFEYYIPVTTLINNSEKYAIS